MWPLSPLPTGLDGVDVFSKCAAGIVDPARARRLRTPAARAAVAAAEAQYRAAGQAHNWTSLDPRNFQHPTSADMGWLYDGPLVQGRVATAQLYALLRGRSIHGKCSLCAGRDVTDLDHYLDRHRYPALAVTPVNLLPTCSDCNGTKSARTPAQLQGGLIHPELERREGHWLIAECVQAALGPVVQFRVVQQCPPGWSAAYLARVQHQFSLLGMGLLYSEKVAQWLSEVKLVLRRLRPGTTVRDYLQSEALSNAAVWTENSWMYQGKMALANSRWFCSVGYAL